MTTPRNSSLAALALALCLANPAWAEKADRGKPIHIEADSVQADDLQKRAIYEGHVVMTQGTLIIQADRIEVQQDEKGLNSGTAFGKPVYFKQRMEASQEYAEGWAERLDYDGHADKLRLVGSARLKRGIEELRGNEITYDGVSEFFHAKGSAGNGGKPGRVRAVIRPRGDALATTPPAPVAP